MPEFIENGQYIIGDFSVVPVSGRRRVKTQTQNGATGLYAQPDGTGTSAGVAVANKSDIDNASTLAIVANSADVQIVSGKLGTGAYLPININVGGVNQWQADTSGRLLNSSLSMPAFKAKRVIGGSTQTAGSALIFDTAPYNYGSGYSAATGLFTAPVSGFYQFSCDASVQNNTGGTVTFNLVISNSTTGETIHWETCVSPNGANTQIAIATAPIYLAANDQITVTTSNPLSATFYFRGGMFLGAMLR